MARAVEHSKHGQVCILVESGQKLIRFSFLSQTDYSLQILYWHGASPDFSPPHSTHYHSSVPPGHFLMVVETLIDPHCGNFGK